MDTNTLLEQITILANESEELAEKLSGVQSMAEQLNAVCVGSGLSPFVIGLTVFVLAIFVGYYVVWKVTPALHSPLMAVTNAISSVIIVGAVLAAGSAETLMGQAFGFAAVLMAAVNIFGGFAVTHRMLEMFNSKK